MGGQLPDAAGGFLNDTDSKGEGEPKWFPFFFRKLAPPLGE
jgi:hypothetical protein